MNTMTLPRKGLKKYDYNIDMEKKDLKKLTKGQLIKLLSKKVSNHEDLLDNDPFKDEVAQEPTKPRTGRWENIKSKPVPRKSVLPPPKGFRDRPPKPNRAPPLPPNDGFNFDDDIFQTENNSLGKFKIVGIRNRENKKFKSYTNEFRVKILKELDNDNEIYHIFQELVKTVKTRRKLSNNDMIRVVIQNEELPNAISTKFNKVESFKLGDLENIINIMEYRGIPLETSKIIVQSVKIPTGKGRLYLTKDTISRKGCIITVKNDDTTCLARSIVTAIANLHPEKWTKTQLHDGFNKSRKLQKEQAMKLHEEAHVEINDYGNDLSDIKKFAKHLGIEINIIDAEQFNSIVHTANKGSEDKVYLLKTRNHFDVIKSLTAFYDTPYYCHECKKAYTKRDKHKCPSKCLSCFTYTKDTKCEGKEIICKKCNRKFLGKRCFKNHLKNRSKIEGKTDIVCDTVKKCNDCSRIITGKYVNSHRCGYSECTNCGKYIDKNHKCFMKKVKAKGGSCMTFKMKYCYNDDSIKKTDWCYPCRTYTEKYMFYDSKQLKTQEPTLLTSQLHKTAKAKNTYITVLRNSVKASLMTNLRVTPSLPIIARDTTVTLF